MWTFGICSSPFPSCWASVFSRTPCVAQGWWLLCCCLKGRCTQVFCKRCRQQRSPVWAGFHSQGLKRCFFLLCCSVSRAFGTVSKGLDRATGGEVSVTTPSASGSSRGLSPLLGAVAAALGGQQSFPAQAVPLKAQQCQPAEHGWDRLEPSEVPKGMQGGQRCLSEQDTLAWSSYLKASVHQLVEAEA